MPTAAPEPVAPQFALVLPNARTRNGVGQTVKDLSEDPYAGADVTPFYDSLLVKLTTSGADCSRRKRTAGSSVDRSTDAV